MTSDRTTPERGAVLVLVAASLLMLMGVAAMVVDLGILRADRFLDQRVADVAASAGVIATFEEDAERGCEAALDYVRVNLPDVASIDSAGCAVFQPTCETSTIARELSVPVGSRFTVTIVNPVTDNHELMNPGAIGASGQTVVAEDGDACDRVGVQVTATSQAVFGRILGTTSTSTTVHAVARAELPSVDEPPLNLLVLDRFTCNAIHVEGNGGVIVESVIDPATGDEFPGLGAADSDASSGCDGVLHVEGSNAVLRADGPPCPTEISPGTGEGCGLLQALAPGTPGCNPPACIPGAGGSNPPVPAPTPLADRMTRRQIDHLYNCRTDYTTLPGGVSWATDPLTTANEQNIPGCTAGTNDHIYDLLSSVGANGPAGHTSWSADLGHPCNVTASQSFSPPAGDVHVDCADFVVEGDVSISGNVIFDGNVWVKSDGELRIANTIGDPGWIVVRDGYFKKDGQASLYLTQTAAYLSNTSWIDIAGGSTGTLSWIAPDSGPFQDLGLWSDSPIMHQWAGQGVLEMVGVFFTPLATAEYSGTSGQNQTEAQWVADKLNARGQGQLYVTPRIDHPIKRDDSVRSVLIR